jgi:diguanylate cyclase (GGDEF)-like protein
MIEHKNTQIFSLCQDKYDSLLHYFVRQSFDSTLNRFPIESVRYNKESPALNSQVSKLGFKTFNDNHGHMTGDLVLKSIAQILKSGCRQEDIVARYGGEEFAIILPYADAHDAFTVAERIRTKVEQYSVPNGRETQTVTVSIGIGVKGEDAESIDQLISCADRALYRAKATGRNRVALFDKTRAVPNVQWFSRF